MRSVKKLVNYYVKDHPEDRFKNSSDAPVGAY